MLSPVTSPPSAPVKPPTCLEEGDVCVPTNVRPQTVPAGPPVVVEEIPNNKKLDIDFLQARLDRYRSNPPETEQYKAAVPFVLQLLKAKIEQKKVEKADYLTAATTCLLVKSKYDLYLKLVKLWANPTAPENLTEVEKMVNDNPIFEPRNPVIRPTPQSVTPMFGVDPDLFKDFRKIQEAVKNNRPVDHNNVIFAITNLTRAGYQPVADILCKYAVLGEEQKINQEILAEIEAAFKQDGKEIP